MPKLTPIAKRLQAVMKAGALTPADVAHWLGKRYPTVYSWAYYGRSPAVTAADEVEKRLARLEREVRRKGALVPYEVGQRERRAFIARLYRATK